MTLNEFIEWVNKNRDNLSGDETLAVHAFGGIGGSGHAVDRISIGFDWDSGKVMLHTKRALQLKPEKKKKEAQP